LRGVGLNACSPQACSDIITVRKGKNMSDFSKMTVAQLKEYALENDIDLGSAKTKTAILSALTNTKSSISVAEEPEEKIIGSTTIVKEKRKVSSNTKVNEEKVLTVGSADNFKNKKFEEKKMVLENKIPIHSEKNMHWNGIGSIKKGYNIVTEEAADLWLTRKGIRKATAEEVASHYGL
jgi:hypothetical protein